MGSVTVPVVERLGDPGRVLLVLGAAKEDNIALQKELFDSYLFLLREDNVLPFSYFFRFRPLPVSDLLHEDIYHLTQAGYVLSTSPICITAQGRSWLRQNLPEEEEGALFREVGGRLASYSNLSRSELSRAVYARLTRPLPR